jgi:hypothetical protein
VLLPRSAARAAAEDEKRTDCGDMEAWRHGGMETWRHGDMEAWRHGGMEAWRHGGMEALLQTEQALKRGPQNIQCHGDDGVEVAQKKNSCSCA